MKRVFAIAFAWGMSLGLASAQIVVQAPAARDDVKACADYAEDVLGDRWDMNQRTDLGWRIFNTVEEPKSNMKNISFADGIFSATSTLSDINIFILDSAYTGSAMNGKNGTNFPINADKYKIFVVRMNTTLNSPGQNGQLLWSKHTIYPPLGGVTTSNPMTIQNGWNIVIVRIPDLGIADGPDPWSGMIDSLRFDPFFEPNRPIQIDWIRLVEEDASTRRTVRWSGNSGNVDIYLDNDNSAANGNLGTVARDVSGTSFSFMTGALAAGNYYVAVAPAGTANYAYAPGYYHVNATPVLNFTKPTAEGSDQDFITLAASDPWDMANAEDVEHTVDLINPRFTTLSYEDTAGNAFANRTVYTASATPVGGTVGDPIVFFLHFLHRGATTPIDTSRYHNLTFKMGIAGAPCVNDGSIARVMWRLQGETYENETQDIIVHHLEDRWVMDKITLDLRTIAQESSAQLSSTGWKGLADCFRLDPHEFPDGRQFFFDDVRLTADWNANTSFTVEWTLEDQDGSPSVSLYYDTDRSGFDGTLIANLPGESPGTGSWVWDTSAVDEGTYWIYAVINDGTNTSRTYAGGPVVIDRALVPIMDLSRDRINMGALRKGVSTSFEEVVLTNAGEGTLNWQARSTKSWLSVTPTSGTGDAVLKIGVAPGTRSAGTYSGQVIVTDAKASNSPLAIDVTFVIYAATKDSGPFGFFDTPVNGSTVSGSIPVSGWALDNIEVTKVEIRREPVTGDPPAAVGADGLIFVGNAVFVQGARPDVEASWPTYPKNDRAGWGYMMLTYGLPNQGNGNFRIHAVAFDATSRRLDLGIKDIVSDNAHRTKPFGTIDTPDQGGISDGTSYTNFGWALTPLPKTIPTDGSTLQVYIDGVPVGRPTYNQFRQDVYDAYPEYNNSSGAVGFYHIDTTAYANGMHTISWSAMDNEGAEDGIGSRYFWIRNLDGAAAATAIQTGSVTSAPAAALPSSPAPVSLRLDQSGMMEIAAPKKRYDIEETGYVKIRFKTRGGKGLAGWGRDKTKALPVGSTLDPKTGTFYWWPGPGFLGKFVLHFAVTNGNFISPDTTVVVNIKPRTNKK